MDSQKLLLLKNKFLSWTIKWAAGIDDNIGDIRFDVPDIVNILQALGFQIRNSDSCNPQEITALKNGKKGMRIILTCLYSGQRYYLENPTEPASYKCIPDEFPKVVAQSTNNNNKMNLISETKNDFIQSPSNEMINKEIIKSDSTNNGLSNPKCPILGESSNCLELSSQEKICTKDDRCVSSEQLQQKPRESGKKSMNVNDRSLEEFYTSVKKVQSDLSAAVTRLEKLPLPKFGKMAVSPFSQNIASQQLQRRSSSKKPSTSQNSQFSTRNNSSPNLFKNRHSMRTPKPNMLSAKKPETRKSKSDDDIKKTNALTEAKMKVPLTSKLYAHVKSTIPKPSILKRNK